jgi:antitoxin component YwqK of YwqJK toxin-antitoxin module
MNINKGDKMIKTTAEVKKYYYKSGSLKCETPYSNGKENGIEKGYYKSGAILEETPYKNGKKDGISKFYYESGEIASTATYKDGILQGYKHCSDGHIR